MMAANPMHREERHSTATVPFTNMITSRSGLRRFCQYLERRRKQVGVPLGLFNAPLCARVFSNAFQVPLGGGEKPVLSHVRGGAYA